MTNAPPDAGVDVAAAAVSDIVRARRVVVCAVGVLAVSMVMTLGSHLWDWSEWFLNGEAPERDEWLDLIGTVWLPMVAITMYRLVKVYRALAGTAQTALDAFQDTVHNVQGWVWRIDADFRIVYSSAGITALLGYRPDEVLGANAIDLLVLEQDKPEILSSIESGATAGEGQYWQTRVKHRDGTVRYVRSCASVVHGPGGRFGGYRGFSADITAEMAGALSDQQHRQQLQVAQARIQQAMADPSVVQAVFQPIFDVATHRIAGVEALSRFSGEPGRSPDVWFGEAWQVGLGPDLELHALGLACAQLPVLPPGAYLSVNASPLTIVDDRFAALLTRLGTDARRVVVEVTEHAVVDDYDTLAAAVQQLRRRGVRLAVDDAGAGYASMQHILRLRPDIIKLDRGIVADIDHDPARHALVTAMAGFATSLGMTVVAEGIETAGELAAVTDAGVHSAQGFYLARPAAHPAAACAPELTVTGTA